jgi:hypothetical protein
MILLVWSNASSLLNRNQMLTIMSFDFIDGGKFPSTLHWRKGCWELRQASSLQGLKVPPSQLSSVFFTVTSRNGGKDGICNSFNFFFASLNAAVPQFMIQGGDFTHGEIQEMLDPVR